MKGFLLLSLVGAVGAMELTKETWDEKTAGKTVFVKFLAPWCGHCKSMKPAWDKLMTKFADHKSILVADVDCTADGKSLCDEVGVEGFPTIKYGDPSNLEDYEGGRDFKEMSKFADENLGPTCGPANLDLCDADKKKQIEEYMAMSGADLKKAITGKDEELAAANKAHEEFVETLQKQYEESEQKLTDKKKEIKQSGLGLMKAVKAYRASVKKEEL